MYKKFYIVLLFFSLSICITQNCYAISGQEATQQIRDTINSDLDKIIYAEIKYWAEQGGNINVQDHKGSTLLIAATHQNNYKLVKQLIKLGCDIHRQNDEGDTAFIIATLKGYKKVAELLYKHGAITSRAHKKRMHQLSKFVTYNKIIAIDRVNNTFVFEFNGPLANNFYVMPKDGLAHIRYPLSGLIYAPKDLKAQLVAKIYWKPLEDMTSFTTKNIKKQFKKVNSRGPMMDLNSYRIVGLQSATPTPDEIKKEYKKMLTFNPPKTFRGKKRYTKPRKPVPAPAPKQPPASEQTPVKKPVPLQNPVTETKPLQDPNQRQEPPSPLQPEAEKVYVQKTSKAKSEIISAPEIDTNHTKAPLDQISLNNLKLVVVMASPGQTGQMTALVEDIKTGQGYVIVPGTIVASGSGKVKTITRTEVLIEETLTDEKGEARTVLTSLPLKSRKPDSQRDNFQEKSQEPKTKSSPQSQEKPQPQESSQPEAIPQTEPPAASSMDKKPDNIQKTDTIPEHEHPHGDNNAEKQSTPGMENRLPDESTNTASAPPAALTVTEPSGAPAAKLHTTQPESEGETQAVTETNQLETGKKPEKPASQTGSAINKLPENQNPGKKQPVPVTSSPSATTKPLDNNPTEENTKTENTTDLTKVQIENLNVIAIVNTPGKPGQLTALVEDKSSGLSFIVLEGMPIGKNSAKVKSINKDSIVLEKTTNDTLVLELKQKN